MEDESKANEAIYSGLFEASDPSGSGKLSTLDVRSILGNTGMTPVQVEAVMAEAQVGGDGCVVYNKFARVCSQYSQAYFGGVPPSSKDFAKMGDAELETYLKGIFVHADTDGSGALDEAEFATLIKESGIGMTRKGIFAIMEEADANNDGLIQYDEFLTLMVDVYKAQRATKEAADRMEIEENKAQEAATDIIMNQTPREEMEDTLGKMFRAADLDGNGSLDRNEFMACVQQFDFGLTAKEIKSLMAQVDKNADGLIEYDEFVPFAIDILIEVVKEKLLEGSSKLAVLMDFFLQSFRGADVDMTGSLQIDQAREVLLDVGMSAIQVENLLREANVIEDAINYKKFSRICAECSMNYVGGSAPSAINMEKRRARAVALYMRIDVDGSGSIDGAEMECYVKQLSAKFRSELSQEEVLERLSLIMGAPVTESGFTDFVIETFAGVDDEHFFAFLDFCDTPSHGARTSKLRQLFWSADSDGSGFLEMDECRVYVKKLAWKLDMVMSDEMITEAVKDFMVVDKNGDGKVSEEEFITSFLELFETHDDQAFLEALQMFGDE